MHKNAFVVRRISRFVAFIVLVLSVVVGGCHLIFPFEVDEQPPRDAGGDGPPGDLFTRPDGGVTTVYNFPANRVTKVDILFVVDNSPQMSDAQRALTTAFPRLVDTLDKYSGGLPDLHIGVVSSDLGAGTYNLPSCEVNDGDKGALQNHPQNAGCTPPSGPYISHNKGVTNVSSAGTAKQKVTSAFTCIAQLGESGCGFEQTIEAARWAVDPLRNTNPGFVRHDALLVLIFLTDEDDCSAAKPALFDPTDKQLGLLKSYRCFEFGVSCTCPGEACTSSTTGPRIDCKPAFDWLHKIASYVQFFKGLKDRPGQVVLAALAGPATPVSVKIDLSSNNPEVSPSCKSPMSTKPKPGIRIKALLDGFRTTSLFQSFCLDDYGPPLEKLGTLISAQMGGACLQPLFDVDPDTPGLQASCTVRDVSGPMSMLVSACGSDDGSCNPCPCWHIKPDPDCATLGGYSLKIVRAKPAAAETIVEATCLGLR